MADNSLNINNKIWNIAGVLMDDGVSNSDYLEQITFLLFLKMIDENKKAGDFANFDDIPLPDGYSWDLLKSKSGDELTKHYQEMLTAFSEEKGMLGEIYRKAQNKIQTPARLKKVIDMIDGVSWNEQSEDVKGEIYEGLLAKIAQDTKSGAGQYFTPRALINVIVKCADPKPGKHISDPCCGSGGFLLAAKKYITDNYNLSGDEQKQLQTNLIKGNEIVPNTYRLCLMNLLLHGIGEMGGESPIKCKDSLATTPTADELSDFVLTNPPFGKKTSEAVEKKVTNKETGEEETKIDRKAEVYSRTDFIVQTTNKQLNFLQHIKSMLKIGGTAAVVLPDNVLFEGGAGENIRKNILKTCDLHTILRLPTGLFYAQGVKANVLFFEKKEASERPHTSEVWIYDYRTGIKHTLKQNPLQESDLQDFINCYNPQNRHQRTETYNAETNPEGRWRRFTYDEITSRDKTSLDITWIKQASDSEDTPLSELLEQIQQKSQNISQAANKLSELLKEIEQ